MSNLDHQIAELHRIEAELQALPEFRNKETRDQVNNIRTHLTLAAANMEWLSGVRVKPEIPHVAPRETKVWGQEVFGEKQEIPEKHRERIANIRREMLADINWSL